MVCGGSDCAFLKPRHVTCSFTKGIVPKLAESATLSLPAVRTQYSVFLSKSDYYYGFIGKLKVECRDILVFAIG